MRGDSDFKLKTTLQNNETALFLCKDGFYEAIFAIPFKKLQQIAAESVYLVLTPWLIGNILASASLPGRHPYPLLVLP